MTDALIGKQLNNFRIDRLLGHGGMAQVYYGIDLGLNRPVAIKVIDERWRQDTPFTVRFISEAQTIATWRHDNIIQVYYAGNEDDIYYFVMEYIDGEDLTSYIKTRLDNSDSIPYEKVNAILRATASGLDYAHSKGVIHRDVKPSNIMLGSDNRVVLMDFGLALDIQKGTIGEGFGTPHYIAPEQARDASTAVAQSDQYALGVIAYEMLTGQVPFDNPSAMTVALMHMTDDPPKPTSLNPNLTPDVEHVLLKVLTKQPSERFPSCQAFVETLEHTLAGRPTMIDDVSPTQIDKILITPPAQSQTETSIDTNKPSSVHTAQRPAQAPQTDNKSRLPLTLAVVVILVIGVIGMIMATGSSNNPVEVEILPTLVAQVAEVVTETPIPTDEPVDTQAPPPTATNTAIPTATDEPTNTPIPPSATDEPTNTSIPPTATDIPTNTFIPPSATDEPTNTFIPPTATDEPTNTPIPPTATDKPTNTPIPPSATDKPTMIPAPSVSTLAYPDGSPMVLYYNDRSFYIWNPTSERIRSGNFKFEALDNKGNILSNTFDGIRWTQFYSFVDSGSCVTIEMTIGTHLKPSECSNYNSVVTATSSSDLIFWTGQNLISGFRVLWQDTEIARCDASAEICNFNIPILSSATHKPTNTPSPPTATDKPTNTPSPPTATDKPTNTPSPPTATDISTNTPSPPTATHEPTNTFSPPTKPTNTPSPPTATHTPTVISATATPTLAYPDGSSMVLYYNDSSFYIWNPTSQRIRSGNFKFEALDNKGNILSNTFDGIRWTQFYSFVDSGSCVAIEMTIGTHLKPSECGNFNSVVNVTSSSDLIFWTGQNLISGFRVLWQDTEIARCDASAEICNFNIPIPPSATDISTNTPIAPTATHTPTVISVTATPTLAYPDGSPVVLYYNDSSFYIWNPTSERIRSGNFKFEALDNKGNILSNTFDGFRWTQFYSFVDSGSCVTIEMTIGTHLKPPECSNYNSVVNATSSSDLIFWTGQNLISGFRVLWQDVEVARCEASVGTCSFNIP